MDGEEKTKFEHLKKLIRTIPDYPKKGILFYDITTLLKNPKALREAIRALAEPFRGKGIDLVVSMESRGFIFGAAVANEIGAGFVPIRKKGKLPWRKVSEEYELEYGTDVVEMHEDAVMKGHKVLICDDLLATGGTAKATVKLIEKQGGKVAALAFLIELVHLKGREKLKGYEVYSILKYSVG
ncbi:MAG: adenine phosphoribosyltransferase [Candidatus Norongarragalinales archaeon]